MMSLIAAPHLPATRTGSTRPCQLAPATPSVLLLTAASWPAMVVPCQLARSASGQPLNLSGWASRSAAVMASPGSCASLSRPLPSPAYTASATKSWPGSTRALVSMCEVMPESSTATTLALATPVLRSQALANPAAPVLPVPAACSHHWLAKRLSLGVTARRCSRTSGTTERTRGSARRRATSAADAAPSSAPSVLASRCQRALIGRCTASGKAWPVTTDWMRFCPISALAGSCSSTMKPLAGGVAAAASAARGDQVARLASRASTAAAGAEEVIQSL